MQVKETTIQPPADQEPTRVPATATGNADKDKTRPESAVAEVGNEATMVAASMVATEALVSGGAKTASTRDSISSQPVSAAPPNQLQAVTASVAPLPLPATAVANQNTITNQHPNAIAAYLLSDPNSQTAEPVQLESNVQPALPIAHLLALGGFVLRREWEQEKKGERTKNLLDFALPEEMTIRRLIKQVNNHMATNGVPLHLVLSRDEKGYSVDVYDCTGSDTCLIVQDIVLDMEKLPVLLANLKEESGILVDTMT